MEAFVEEEDLPRLFLLSLSMWPPGSKFFHFGVNSYSRGLGTW